MDISPLLKIASGRNQLPAIIAYNRIDGPGSSLDLREFQQSLWRLPETSGSNESDESALWTEALPRTIGITIDIGTRIEARPFDPGLIAVRSIEYGTESTARAGHVIPTKENWLLKILDVFGISGVMFVLHNLRPGIHSLGLGGSATATTGVVILANELAGRPLSSPQVISLASRMEQDLGVSLTGTQEQANVVYGGVVDYVWFPWGIPERADSGYGSCLRYELLQKKDYPELEQRMAVFHSGHTRASTDVNSVWMKALSTAEGYQLHQTKIEIAYRFREAIRLRKWHEAIEATRKYQEVRTKLCSQYMEGSTEILGFAEQNDSAAFPLGAGGGGAVLVLAPDSASLQRLRQELSGAYREINFRILENGHDLINLPLERR